MTLKKLNLKPKKIANNKLLGVYKVWLKSQQNGNELKS